MIKAIALKLKAFRFKLLYETVFYYIKHLYRKFEKDHIWVLSSGIAFNIVLCIIPFNLILITVLGIYLESSDTIEKFSRYLEGILPFVDTFKAKFIAYLVDRVREITSYTFITGAIGIGGLLWLMSGLFSSMRDVLNRIYNVEDNINFLIGKLRDFVLIIITLVLFLLSFSLTSGFQIIQDYSKRIFGVVITFNIFETIVPILVSFMITFSLFYVLYAFVPNIKFPRKAVIFSSFYASIFFEILKYFFTLYVLNFSNFGKVYGAYATLVIILFWLYYMSVVFVVGAALGQIYTEKNNLKFPHIKKHKSKFYGTAKVIQND